MALALVEEAPPVKTQNVNSNGSLWLDSPEPLVSSGEIWGNKGKVPLEHSKNVLYFSSTLSCHIIQQLRLVVSYLIIDHGIYALFSYLWTKNVVI